MERLQISARGSPGRCVYCKGDVDIAERAACAACLAVHHRDCFEIDACCAACGQSEVLVRQDGPIEATEPRVAPHANEQWVVVRPLLAKPQQPRRRKMDWRRFFLIMFGFVGVVLLLALLGGF